MTMMMSMTSARRRMLERTKKKSREVCCCCPIWNSARRPLPVMFSIFFKLRKIVNGFCFVWSSIENSLSKDVNHCTVFSSWMEGIYWLHLNLDLFPYLRCKRTLFLPKEAKLNSHILTAKIIALLLLVVSCYYLGNVAKYL